MSKSFYKKIIVAINGSQSSIHAAMYAIMMAKSYNLALKVVYVVDTATIKYLTMNKFFITEEKEEFEKKLKIDGEHYLNSIEMGDGIYGAEAVAQQHFSRPSSELTRANCALVAATLPNPLRFSSQSPSPYMLRRQTAIMREMRHIEVFPQKE